MSEIKIGRMVLGAIQTNCYYVYREGAGEAFVIDPADHGRAIHDKLVESGLKVSAILLTHGHFDHIWGAAELKKLSGAKLYAGAGEKELLSDPVLNCSKENFRPESLEADVWLEDGEQISPAGIEIQVIATPGHTAGGVCYYLKEEGILFAGDTLFQDSVGRTDFPTGSMGALVRSVKEKLFVLPESVEVLPGHGDFTTIGYEMKYNPYCS